MDLQTPIWIATPIFTQPIKLMCLGVNTRAGTGSLQVMIRGGRAMAWSTLRAQTWAKFNHLVMVNNKIQKLSLPRQRTFLTSLAPWEMTEAGRETLTRKGLTQGIFLKIKLLTKGSIFSKKWLIHLRSTQTIYKTRASLTSSIQSAREIEA